MADKKEKKVRRLISPIGTAKWAFLNKPKTTFKKQGEFMTNLLVPEAEAQAFIEVINEMTDEYFNEVYNEAKAKDRKELRKHYPFSAEETDEGVPTGNVEFKFHANATYEKNGETQSFTPTIVDKRGDELDPKTALVFSGSIIRVSCNASPYYNTSNRTVGVTLYLRGVQVIKFAKKDTAASLGFGAVEGYDDDDDDDMPSSTGADSGSVSDAEDF